MSKAALNMAGRNLSIDMRDKGVSVHLVHPGYVRCSDRWRGLMTAREAAEQIASLTKHDLVSKKSGRVLPCQWGLPW
ncbi:MAG: hypothetical protein R3D99_02585 [Altererythrobacter sp.]